MGRRLRILSGAESAKEQVSFSEIHALQQQMDCDLIWKLQNYIRLTLQQPRRHKAWSKVPAVGLLRCGADKGDQGSASALSLRPALDRLDLSRTPDISMGQGMAPMMAVDQVGTSLAAKVALKPL